MITLEKVTDYGLGTFNGQPLVLWCMGGHGFIYHLNDHGGRLRGVTFTEEFMIDGMQARACKTCVGSTASGRSGRTAT